MDDHPNITVLMTARGDEIVVEATEDGVELTITNEDGDIDTAVVMPVTTAVWLRDVLTAAIDQAEGERP